MELRRAFRIEGRDVLALVGTGDTHGVAQALATELAGAGRRVVTMSPTSETECAACWRPSIADDALHELETLLAEHGGVTVVVDQSGPFSAGELAARIPQLPFVDNTIIEVVAAGSDRNGNTARVAPAIPPGTTCCVPLVNLDEAVDHPADRLVRVDALPATARLVPMVKAVESDRRPADDGAMADARSMADCWLAQPRVHHVVLRVCGPEGVGLANQRVEVRTRVAAVVLAAGASSRYGQLKQLLPWRGGTLLSQVVDTVLASSARPVVVVLGNEADVCRRALGDRPVGVVVNGLWAEGQSTSIRAGLSALPENVTAALFPLADTPLLTAATLDALLDRYWRTFAPAVWPEYAQKRGNPVLFDRALFSELRHLTGDVGGRSVIQSHFGDAERVSVPDAGILIDIDTPNEYSRYSQPTSGSSKP